MRHGFILIVLLASAVGALGAQIPRNPDAATVLPRAAAWLQTLEKQFAVVVADEAYHQQIGDQPYPAAPKENFRELQSEIAFLWVPEEGMWIAARNVRTVDKEPVNGSSDRLQRILAEAKTRVQALQGLRGESAKFNLGALSRNFNDPTYALQYLDPRWQSRFIWAQSGREQVNGVETWRFDFTELNQPYVIQATGYTLPSAGRMWVDPATGIVYRTQLDVWDPQARVRAKIEVDLARDTKLGLVVPSRMKEEYLAYPATGGLEVTLTIRGTADYTNFRRFETSGRLLQR